MGLNESDIRRIVWTFVQAFAAVFLTFAIGFLNAPNWAEWKAAAVGAVAGAVAAGLSAVKNLITPDGSTLK